MIKQSKFLLNAGKVDAAKVQIENARRSAMHNRQFAHYLPIAEHRLAMVLKSLKQYRAAREHFERAEQTFDHTDRIGYAILLRDYGLFLGCELRDYEAGREKILKAQRLLKGRFDKSQTRRASLERIVTDGCLYRIRLRKNRFDTAALYGLKQVDVELRHITDSKPGYQLDNLGWIVSYEKRVSEVNPYLPRAIYLSARLGNIPRTAEYTIMASGGQVVRATLERIF